MRLPLEADKMSNPRKSGKTLGALWWFWGMAALGGIIPTGILVLNLVNAASEPATKSGGQTASLWWLLPASAGWAAAFVLALFAARFYPRRLREDATVFARVKAGEHSARFKPPHGPEGLVQFYSELNSMLDSLSERMAVYQNILGHCTRCAVVATDGNGAVIAWNKGAALLLGVPAKEMKNQQLWGHLEGGEDKWREITARCSKNGGAFFGVSVVKEKAAAAPVEMAIVRQGDGSGGVVRYIALLHDTACSSKREADLASYAEGLRAMVEDRSNELLKKNAELEQTNKNMLKFHEQLERRHEQLKAAHEFLDSILRTVSTGVMTVNKNGVITSFNKAAEQITGFNAAEVIGQKCAVLRGDPCLQKCCMFPEGLEEPMNGRKCTMATKQGRKVTILRNASYLRDSAGDIIGGVESFVDITHFEETERKLNEADERLQKILACAADVAIVTMDRDGVLTSFNEGAKRLSGWEPWEVTGKKAADIFTNPDEATARAAGVITTAKSEGRYEGYVNFLHKNGEHMRAYLTLMPLTNAGGEHYGYVGVSRAESAGKDYVSPIEKVSHEIVMTMPDPCLMLDDNGIVSCANDAAGQILHAETGKEWKPAFDGADEWWSGEVLRRMLGGGHPQPVAFEAMVGQRFYEITLTPVTDPNAVGALIVSGRDVTEAAVLRRQLVQQDKLVTVGMLTAGVAHEFNNLLGGMLGYASLAKNDPIYREKLVEVVENQGNRAVEMAQGLINYSRKDIKGSEFADVRKVIDEVLALVSRDMEKHSIKIVREYQNVPATRMNVGQIEQVLLNLFVNARQAMEQGGVLTVGTRRERDNVLVTVADTGCGIKDEDRHKIFQPFYTTKRAKDGKQEGTGLGLSVSYNIIKQHRGSIRVESEVGKGSAFTVALPLVEESQQKEMASERPEAVQVIRRARKARRIVVVDDEAILRSLYSEILTAAGHEVVCVDSGRKAVDLIETGSFDLLFLDITLGGEWDGAETFRQVKARNTGIKIILSTGSVEHSHVQPYIKQADAFIQKPFTMNDLLPLVESL